MAVAPDIAGTPTPPRHVAVIMDGNGRWAKLRGLPRAAGHRQGAEAAKRVVRAAAELGIPYITLYSFSAENWSRPEQEVDDLMNLLRTYLRSEVADLHEQGARLRVIGDRSRLARDIVELIEHTERLTADNKAITVVIALSYGSRQEIAEAARTLAHDVLEGRLQPHDIDVDAVEARLFTHGMPDPDVVIRTSGEKRLSNFLSWQAAYAELVFVDRLWPDFAKRDLEAALEEFYRRERRYGGATVG